MILPIPELPRRWSDCPVTLALAAANILVFVLFFSGQDGSSAVDLLSDRDLRTAGRLLLTESQAALRPPWAQDRHVPPQTLETYGQVIVRDRRFLESLEAGQLVAAGDPVAVKTLMDDARRFHDDLERRALHRFGLSSERQDGLAWVTYQFAHANLLHLLSNLIFLLLLGFALEASLGGATLLGLYLLGGFAGGWAFLAMDPHGVVPMVGASGAVSALIAAYPMVETRRRVRYFFFILPARGQNGFLYLPTLLIVPLFLLTDVAAILASPAGLLTGVAYSAHVGGALMGAVVGGFCRVLRRKPEVVSPSDDVEI